MAHFFPLVIGKLWYKFPQTFCFPAMNIRTYFEMLHFVVKVITFSFFTGVRYNPDPVDCCMNLYALLC